MRESTDDDKGMARVTSVSNILRDGPTSKAKASTESTQKTEYVQ